MLTLWRKKDAIQMYHFHYLGPGQEVDPPSRVNFSEHLYEKRSSPLCGGQELPPGENFLYINGALLICRPQSLEKNRRVVSGFWPFKQMENVGWKWWRKYYFVYNRPPFSNKPYGLQQLMHLYSKKKRTAIIIFVDAIRKKSCAARLTCSRRTCNNRCVQFDQVLIGCLKSLVVRNPWCTSKLYVFFN